MGLDRKELNCVYRLRATALCPVDGSRDHYDVEIRSTTQLKAEAIRAYFESKANWKVFQEDLAVAAGREFRAIVTITGDHPSPIQIETLGGTP